MQTITTKAIEDPISFFGILLPIIIVIYQILKVIHLWDSKTTVERVTASYAEKNQEDFLGISILSIGLTIIASTVLAKEPESIFLLLGKWIPSIAFILAFIAFLIPFIVSFILSVDKWESYSKRKRNNIRIIILSSIISWFLSLFLLSIIIHFKDINVEYYLFIFGVLLINFFYLQLSISIYQKTSIKKMQYRIENMEQDEVDKKLKEMYVVGFLDSDRVLLSEHNEEYVHYKKSPYYIYIISSNSIRVIREINENKCKE